MNEKYVLELLEVIVLNDILSLIISNISQTIVQIWDTLRV